MPMHRIGFLRYILIYFSFYTRVALILLMNLLKTLSCFFYLKFLQRNNITHRQIRVVLIMTW